MAHNIKSVSKKTFQKDGRWVEPKGSRVVICLCGAKYIRTRDRQTRCIKCIYGKTDGEAASLK